MGNQQQAGAAVREPAPGSDWSPAADQGATPTSWVVMDTLRLPWTHYCRDDDGKVDHMSHPGGGGPPWPRSRGGQVGVSWAGGMEGEGRPCVSLEGHSSWERCLMPIVVLVLGSQESYRFCHACCLSAWLDITSADGKPKLAC